MIHPHAYLALDCGAESARVMLGLLEDGRLTLEEIYRFPTGAVELGDSLRWDALRMAEELRNGVRLAAQRGLPIESLSTDSWGLDYVLTRANEPMLTPPRHYRDPRNSPAFDWVRAQLGEELIFEETGIQFMPINTLFQLAAAQQEDPELLRFAERLIPIGDWFNFLFSGKPVCDVSLASTTQLYNPHTRTWSNRLIEALQLPRHLFPEIVPCGTVLGPILPQIQQATGLPATTQVIASCSHDTGAALAGTPAAPGAQDWAFVSCGTWSLLGVERPEPVITPKSRQHNLTNEVGLDHTVRVLKNISGLWVVQECRRHWEAQGTSYSYEELTQLAEATPALRSLINLQDPRFSSIGEMPEKIRAYCSETQQPLPEVPGAYIRCALESLAFAYRKVMDELEDATETPLNTLHIVGGGSKNRLLNQLAANATGRRICSGPAEATAVGNLLIQALALGHLSSREEIRETVRQSFSIEEYHPESQDLWQPAYQRYRALP